MKSFLSYFLSAIIFISSFLNIMPVYANELKTNTTTKGFWSEDNKPEFYGTTKIVLREGENFSLDNAIYRIFARDFEDFNISHKIQASHNVNTSVAGEYKINYSVTDSHGNTSSLEVPVIVTKDAKNMIERTMYSLPSVDNIAAMGIHRGNNHDRQMLGIFVQANSEVRIRKVSGDNNLTYTMLNNDSHTEKSETITNEWKSITFNNNYTPFIKTLYKQNTPIKVEIEWDSNNKGVKELNYYHHGDDEAKFFDKWNKDVDSYAVIEGEAVTVLVPYSDRNFVVNHWKKGFETIDEFLSYWKSTVDIFDDMLGLEYAPSNPMDQNVKSKFFVKANAHGAGAAYYSGDHVGVNKASVASFFERNWGGLHEFGHGYQGSLGKGDLGIGEVSNNIFGHYVQINEKLYPFKDDWLGKLPDIEQEINNLRLNGKTFHDLGVKHKLYFIVNFLDSFEGPDTYKQIAKLYRHNIISGNTLSTQDAWALAISESYGVDITDYFEEWGIKVSDNTKLKIQQNNSKNVFSMKDLVNDDSLTNTIRNDLKLHANYGLVTNEKLSKYNLTGNLKVNISIDNEELIKGKYIVLKDGDKEVYRKKIDSTSIEILNIPIGSYKLIVPEFIGSYTNNTSNLIISNNKTTENEIVYYNIENINTFDNDVKVQFQGYYYNDAAEITLSNSAQTNSTSVNDNLKLNFRYRGTTLFNYSLAKDYEYAKIQVLDNNGNEVYLKKVGGKGEMFSSQNQEIKEIPVEIGYKLILKYNNAKDKLKFISTLNNDYRTVYEAPNSTEATFIVTENGLRPINMSDEDFYNEYTTRLKTYIEKFKNSVEEEELYIKSLYKSEKGIIVRAYKKMNDADKAIYQDLYNKIVYGKKPEIAFENKEIETKINEEIDLYSLINASDFEDGTLDKSNIKIETDLNIKKLGSYEVKYIVTDSDKNVSSKRINIKVVAHEYDLSKLQELIEKVEKLNKDDYILESYKNLENQLIKSKGLILREDLTQDVVDNEIKILQNLMDKLELLKKYIVTFETNGGNEIEKLVDVIENSKINSLEDPIKDGFSFAGWYKDESYNEIWDFETDIVNKDIVLYAKWIKTEKIEIPEIPETNEDNTGETEKTEIPQTNDKNTDEIKNKEVSQTNDAINRKIENEELKIIVDENDKETKNAEVSEPVDQNNDIQNVKTSDTFNFKGWFLILILSSIIIVSLCKKYTTQILNK